MLVLVDTCTAAVLLVLINTCITGIIVLLVLIGICAAILMFVLVIIDIFIVGTNDLKRLLLTMVFAVHCYSRNKLSF
jgi:hypothetical protein